MPNTLATFNELKPSIGLPANTRPTRPYSTYYYDSTTGSVGDWNAIGRAATVNGAIRAAFVRILFEKAERALVHSEYGEVVARLHRTPKGISVIHVPSIREVH